MMKRVLTIFIVLFWVFGCNLPASEALFAALHDTLEHHHESHSDHEPHDHHSNHHPGHDLPHQHEGLPDHEPHGDCGIKTVAVLSSVASNLYQSAQPVDVVGCVSLPHLPEHSLVLPPILAGPPGRSLLEYSRISLPRAPPAVI